MKLTPHKATSHQNILLGEKGFSIVAALMGLAIIGTIAYLVASFVTNSSKISSQMDKNFTCEFALKSIDEALTSNDNSLTVSNFGPTSSHPSQFPQGLDQTPDGFDRFYLNSSTPYHSSSQTSLNLPSNGSFLTPDNWRFTNYLNYKNSFNRVLAILSNRNSCCDTLDCFQPLFAPPDVAPADFNLPLDSNLKVYLAANVSDKTNATHCANNRFNSSVYLDPKTARINYKLRVTLYENTDRQKNCETQGQLSFPTADRHAPLTLVQMNIGNLCAGTNINATLSNNDEISVNLRTVTGTSLVDIGATTMDSCLSHCIGATRDRTCSEQALIGVYNNLSLNACSNHCQQTEPGSLFLCRIGEKEWFFDNPAHWEPCHSTQVYACDGTKAADVVINHINTNFKASSTEAQITLRNFTKNGEYMIDVRAVDPNGNIGPSFCGNSGSCDSDLDISHVTVQNPTNNATTPACSNSTVCQWQYDPWPACPTDPCGSTVVQNRNATCNCPPTASNPNPCGPQTQPTARNCDTAPCSNNCQWMTPTTYCQPCGQNTTRYRTYKCFCEEMNIITGTLGWTDYSWMNPSPCPTEPNRPSENLGPCFVNCPPPPPCHPPDWRPPSRPTMCCDDAQTYYNGHPCYTATTPPTCSWNLGDWQCNTSTGMATRTVSCSCSDPNQCPSPKPPDEQSCDACSYVSTGWGSCINNIETEQFACRYSNGTACSNCSGTAPTNTRPCGSCTWTSTGWSQCANNLETEQFACQYSNGNSCSNCSGTAPSNSRPCGSCSYVTTDWSTCNNGTQTRTYSCQYANGSSCSTCTGATPTTTQSCPLSCSWQASTSDCVNGSESDCPNPRVSIGVGMCLDEPPKIPKFRTTTYSCKQVDNPSQSCPASSCSGNQPSPTRSECGVSNLICQGYNIGGCGVGYCCPVGSSPCQVGGCTSGPGCLSCESGTTTYTWQSYSSEDVSCASPNCSLYLGQPCSPRLDQIMCCASPFRRRILECR